MPFVLLKEADTQASPCNSPQTASVADSTFQDLVPFPMPSTPKISCLWAMDRWENQKESLLTR